MCLFVKQIAVQGGRGAVQLCVCVSLLGEPPCSDKNTNVPDGRAGV